MTSADGLDRARVAAQARSFALEERFFGGPQVGERFAPSMRLDSGQTARLVGGARAAREDWLVENGGDGFDVDAYLEVPRRADE